MNNKLDFDLKFTDTYRGNIEKHKAERELACLKVQFLKK